MVRLLFLFCLLIHCSYKIEEITFTWKLVPKFVASFHSPNAITITLNVANIMTVYFICSHRMQHTQTQRKKNFLIRFTLEFRSFCICKFHFIEQIVFDSECVVLLLNILSIQWSWSDNKIRKFIQSLCAVGSCSTFWQCFWNQLIDTENLKNLMPSGICDKCKRF